uniref:NADH dehydrogenase [ubiquinone] 1 beta subcomplex subunit 7 n=1 Tax=Mycena chlorophos TaxID=658473 RepID=A0ABQ0LVT0_MYCCL|nr:predicted protein [Mycena chlorophos]
MSSPTTASQEELKAHRVPLQWRDSCSALVIPLNVCRKKTLYMPWECDHERHAYEKCVGLSCLVVMPVRRLPAPDEGGCADKSCAGRGSGFSMNRTLCNPCRSLETQQSLSYNPSRCSAPQTDDFLVSAPCARLGVLFVCCGWEGMAEIRHADEKARRTRRATTAVAGFEIFPGRGAFASARTRSYPLAKMSGHAKADRTSFFEGGYPCNDQGDGVGPREQHKGYKIWDNNHWRSMGLVALGRGHIAPRHRLFSGKLGFRSLALSTT